MWIVRAYKRRDDELAAEYELRDVLPATLVRAVGSLPSAFVSTPLDGGALSRLAEDFPALKVAEQVPPELMEWFLELDAEPTGEFVSRPGARARG